MMLLSQATTALHAEMVGDDALFTGVSKDTRSIRRGDLYVAIRGESFDGHEFVQQAADAGAAGALVDEIQSVSLPQLCVDDTRLALGQLASHWRDGFNGKLVGITGSNGKTTVKEMCRRILEQAVGNEHVLSTAGNLNNDIGLPLTLLGLREQHRYAVIEMGASHVGEIDYLAQIARPHVALINNAGAAHLQGFGSVAQVALAKSEIYRGLVDGGIAIINADDAHANLWREVCAERKVLRFSMQTRAADVFGEVTTVDGARELYVETPSGSGFIKLQVSGLHNAMNALAATAVASALGISLKVVISALSAFTGVPGRLAISRAASGACIIDDSYNANPRSLDAAMQVLVEQRANNRADSWLVLGDMAELGTDTELLHQQAGQRARELGVRHLLATGEASRHAVEAFGKGAEHFADKARLIERLSVGLKPNSVALIKGSRTMAMEQVVNALLDNTTAGGTH
jgi:UDP-N-acetylmuramoyl-tripeptide--D-alanyl-D-alanine ligase